MGFFKINFFVFPTRKMSRTISICCGCWQAVDEFRVAIIHVESSNPSVDQYFITFTGSWLCIYDTVKNVPERKWNITLRTSMIDYHLMLGEKSLCYMKQQHTDAIRTNWLNKYLIFFILTPVDGGWGGWSQWSAQCSVTCGQGVRTRDRHCVNPPPAHGGASCVGDAFDSQACQTPDCPGKLN